MLAKSPSLEPRPVKSNRSTPMPSRARVRLIVLAARISFPHVKQCAKTAYARIAFVRTVQAPREHVAVGAGETSVSV